MKFRYRILSKQKIDIIPNGMYKNKHVTSNEEIYNLYPMMTHILASSFLFEVQNRHVMSIYIFKRKFATILR
jgi:hypothetical protein